MLFLEEDYKGLADLLYLLDINSARPLILETLVLSSHRLTTRVEWLDARKHSPKTTDRIRVQQSAKPIFKPTMD